MTTMHLRKKITYRLSELLPYINWAYFYHAWQVKDEGERERLRTEAEQLLRTYEHRYHAYALFLLADANSDGDDLVIDGVRFPLLREQQYAPRGYSLCLSDFVRPMSQGIPDTIGIFATTVDRSMETDFCRDEYQQLMMQLLADRLAEAAAEKMHEEVRKVDWGYASDEQLTISELHAEKFQGIRPAVGYPSLPDASCNFIIDRLLHLSSIGIRLTENGAMRPHASVSGLMLAHPRAHYFSVGKIDEQQLRDYARRRAVPVALMRRFLGAIVVDDANLSHRDEATSDK